MGRAESAVVLGGPWLWGKSGRYGAEVNAVSDVVKEPAHPAGQRVRQDSDAGSGPITYIDIEIIRTIIHLIRYALSIKSCAFQP